MYLFPYSSHLTYSQECKRMILWWIKTTTLLCKLLLQERVRSRRRRDKDFHASVLKCTPSAEAQLRAHTCRRLTFLGRLTGERVTLLTSKSLQECTACRVETLSRKMCGFTSKAFEKNKKWRGVFFLFFYCQFLQHMKKIKKVEECCANSASNLLPPFFKLQK